MKKIFVGGYYDNRIFEGEYFDGKTPFNADIDTYTLDEALNLGFVENVKEWYVETYDQEWDVISEKAKAKAIIEYTEGDDIAGLLMFNTEEEAEKYKQYVLEEIKDLENKVECVGKEQDKDGYYHEIYELKDDK